MSETMDSDTITVGELGVRFLVEAADSTRKRVGVRVPCPSRLADAGAAQPRRVRGDDLRAGGHHDLEDRQRNGRVLATSAGGPPNLAAIGQGMRRHGLTPTPPGYSISTRQEQPR